MGYSIIFYVQFLMYIGNVFISTERKRYYGKRSMIYLLEKDIQGT